jgi:hypothetical protein
MVCEATGKKWSNSILMKSDMVEHTCKHLIKLKLWNIPARYIRLDPTGENQKLGKYTGRSGWAVLQPLDFEFMSHDTPWQHHLWPSCHLDSPILHYCVRNRTISTMVFLLHYGHYDRKRGRWDCNECKWIFIAILPHNHKSVGQFPHWCSFLWSPRLSAQDDLKGTFHRLHSRFENQPDMVEFEWVELARQSSCWGNSHDCVAKQRWQIREWNICHPSENGTDVDKVVFGRRDRNAAHHQVMQLFF